MHSASETTLARWADHSFGAAAGTGRWSAVLEDICASLGAVGAALFTPPGVPAGEGFVASCGNVTQQTTQDYFSHWHAQDPWNASPRLGQIFTRAGELRHGHEFIEDHALRRTDFFNAVSRPNGGGRIVCLKVFGDDGLLGPPVHLTVLRPLADRPVGDDGQAMLRRFQPHLQAALGCARHLRRAAPAGQAHDAALLDELPQCLWLLRADGGVVLANRAARALPAARVAQGLLLRLGTLERDSLLQRIGHALAGRGAAQRQRFEFGYPVRSGWWQVSALAPGSMLRARFPQARVLATADTAGQPAHDRPPLQRLQQRYALTAAEAAVLDLLGQGLPVSDIAVARGVSPVTVRSHLRALFDKTGLRRQAALVRLVAGLHDDAP